MFIRSNLEIQTCVSENQIQQDVRVLGQDITVKILDPNGKQGMDKLSNLNFLCVLMR